MPRPVKSTGSQPQVAAAAGRAKQPTDAFDELLVLLQGEHQRLFRFTDALAVENSALRERLQLCGEIAEDARSPDAGSPSSAVSGPTPSSFSALDCGSVPASSLWRRHLGVGSPTNPDHIANLFDSAPPLTHRHLAATELVAGAGKHDVRCLASERRKSSSREQAAGPQLRDLPTHGSADTDNAEESAAPGDEESDTHSIDPADESLDADQELRKDACITKLRDMFEMADTRTIVYLEFVQGYFKRFNMLDAKNANALSAMFDGMLKYEQTRGIQSSSKKKEKSSSKRSPTTHSRPAPSRSMSMSKTMSKLSGASVTLDTLATVLLAKDAGEILDDVDEDMEDALRTLRTHTFHQDAMGILPSVTAVSNLEKDYKVSKLDQRFDILMNLVIAANAVCMGWFAQQQTEEWGTPQVLDIIFTLIFMLEAVIKIQRNGFRTYFCGKDWAWNCFDASIVALGVSDFIMTLAVVSSGSFNPSSLMALRLLRLGRLMRVIRMSLFRELKLMINGIVGLLKTLGCALIILLVGIYFIGTACVQMFGKPPDGGEIVHGQSALFETVPRSMFTVFRCLNLGDCNAADGTPIALQMSEVVGWPFTVTHCVLSVLMNYGLGSLITALVVDTTLNEAKKAEFRNSLKESTQKQTSWSLHRLQRIFEEQQKKEGVTTGERGENMLFLTRKTFQATLKRQDVQRIFDEMDIDNADRCDLFDALDADGNGHIEIDELVRGLIRMSGKARRADTVATRLKIDALVKRFTVVNQALLEDTRLIMDHLEGGSSAVTTPNLGKSMRDGRRRPSLCG